MQDLMPERDIPEWSDEGRRAFTAAMQIKWIGDLSAAASRFGTSLDYYRRVIAEIHFQIGDCHFKQNDWPRAAEEFRRSVEADPTHSRAAARLNSCVHLTNRMYGSEK